MNETIESILIGTSLLSVLAVMALIVTASRYSVSSDRLERERFVVLFLAGVALQCIHFAEEFLTGFNLRFPELLGLTPWPGEFFVAFNVCWIAVWTISAAGLLAGYRLVLFPVWFFAFGMTANGVGHPLLAAASAGYFPGLLTSPIVGTLGVWLWYRLSELTCPKPTTRQCSVEPVTTGNTKRMRFRTNVPKPVDLSQETNTRPTS